MELVWITSASGMLLASAGQFSYSIFRPGGGYYTLGRTSSADGIMVVLGTNFVTPEDAQAQAQADYEAQANQPPPTT